jgi:NADH:ubiquinone oxidoreductase subunit 6 (subunit J)
MDLDFIFSVILVIISTMTVFSRQPFFAVFSFVGLVFTIMLVFLLKGSVMLSTVLLLSMGTVILVTIVQLFMNLDLEKEFQQYYKMNVVPMFGMMVMGVILGVLSLAVFGAKSLFSTQSNQMRFGRISQTSFESYDVMVLFSVMGLLGVVTTATLLLKGENEELEEEL